MRTDDLAAIMRALGHPVRLHILAIIAARSESCCCNEVTDHLPLAQSTVSQHLKVLYEAGIIERRACGTRSNYRVCTDRLSAFRLALGAYVEELESASDCGKPILERT